MLTQSFCLCLMRQKTISTVKNTLINYSNTGTSIGNTVTEVSLDNLILHNFFHCSNSVSRI